MTLCVQLTETQVWKVTANPLLKKKFLNNLLWGSWAAYQPQRNGSLGTLFGWWFETEAGEGQVPWVGIDK